MWSGLDAALVLAAVKVGGDGEAGLGLGGAGIIQNLLIGVERFTRPVSGHLREQTMFDGVPFGSSGGIVGHGDRQVERVGQLGLKLGLPGVAAIAVTAASVGENEKLARAGIATRAFLLPPMGDGMSGKGGRVVGDTHDEGTAIFGDVVNAIGNGDAEGVGAKVVVEDATRAAFPTAAWIAEIADQFALFGVDADDRQMATLEAAAQFGQIFELEIAIGLESVEICL